MNYITVKTSILSEHIEIRLKNEPKTPIKSMYKSLLTN